VEQALRALADPGRRRILALVRTEERSAGEIAAQLPVTWPAVSQHLRVLKTAGLISERREGTRRYYRARPEGLADVRAFLDELWDDKLQALKREVERG
jgi:DNA-binding transcriptional ArsR family regulator